jgi:YfiH family protein
MMDELITPNWNIQGVRAGFSTASVFDATTSPREASDMGINTLSPLGITEKNRAKFVSRIGLDAQHLAIVRQVHGTQVIYATQSGILGEADGLVTDVDGLSIGILVADCAAVLICDPINRVVGAFHAGWRGAAGGIVVNGITKMRELGASDFYVWMSPCIGLNAFEVGDEVADQFPAEFVHTQGFQKPHVDLKSFLIQQLQDIGVHRDRIFSDSRCTFEDSNLFSFRRQGKESGRMMGVIGLE